MIASIIFKVADAKVLDDPSHDATYLGKSGVSWVLRFGGLCTLVRKSRLRFSLIVC